MYDEYENFFAWVDNLKKVLHVLIHRGKKKCHRIPDIDKFEVVSFSRPCLSLHILVHQYNCPFLIRTTLAKQILSLLERCPLVRGGSHALPVLAANNVCPS